MITPRTIIITGYGINCEEETKFAFEKAGAKAKIVHLTDLIEGDKSFKNYQIAVFPGGFSFGDDTGSGKALAHKFRHKMKERLSQFVAGDNLVIGICNGFQVLVNLGLVPALNQSYEDRKVALVHNDSARYIDRWVDLEFEEKSVWTQGIKRTSFPIAHGEGKFYAPREILVQLQQKNLIAARYVAGEMAAYQSLPANPNGSLEDIAAITDESGRILGMMPHPERAIDFTQLPHWTLLKEQYKRNSQLLPLEGPGLKIFKNAVQYFL